MIRLLEWLRSQRRATLLVIAGVMIGGLAAAFRLSSGILPEVTFPRISVLADSGDRPAEEMARVVTRPLESALRRVPELREIRSVTSRGSTEINLDFAWSADMRQALQVTQSLADEARTEFPAGTTVQTRLMSPALFPVVGLSLTSRTHSLAELRDIAVMRIQPELARMDGVADVLIQGGRRLEARVTLDPHALESRRLDTEAVVAAIRASNEVQAIGPLEANGELYLGFTDARPRDLSALERIAVPIEGAAPAMLGELGKVSLEPVPEYTRYVAGQGDAVLINILRKRSANTVRLSSDVRAWFRRNAKLLPADTRVETFYDQSDLIRRSVDGVRDSLLIGSILAVLAAILFLGSARLGLWAALLLPGTIALTLAGLAAGGQTLNLMTLGGIAAAVGLVLDDAIVVVEHVAHRLAAGETHPLVPLAEVAPDLVGSSLCTLAIFIPFMALDGVTGAFFRVLALAMALMLGSSLVLCIVGGPWVARGLKSGVRPPRAVAWFDRLLEGAVRRPAFSIGALVLVILSIVPLGATLGSGFLPGMDEGSLIMDYVSPPGSSLEETDRMLRQVEREIATIPEIETWSRRTGDQLGFFLTEPNTGDYVIKLAAKRKRSADDVADALRERIAIVEPALDIEFGQLIEDVVGDLTTSPQPIEVRIIGEDRVLDEARATDAAALIGRVPGVVDARRAVVVSGSNLIVTPGPAAWRAGITPDDLARRVEPLLQGTVAGQIPRGARAWPVRVVLPRPTGERGPAGLAEARIPFVPGHWARLRDLAEMRVAPGETEIHRDNLRTMAAATARLSGRDLGSAMREVQARIAHELVLGPGMSVQYAGLWAEQQSSFRGLALVLLGAAASVVFVLLIVFRSWQQALCVLLVAVGSLAGVLAALHVGGDSFNISSFVGAIMMIGIVAENAYFLLAEHTKRLANGETPAAAATAAARRRFRPVIMTTAAGVAALLPLAIGAGARAALLRPLAIAVIGGFTVSAPLLLLVLPVLLARSGPARD